MLSFSNTVQSTGYEADQRIPFCRQTISNLVFFLATPAQRPAAAQAGDSKLTELGPQTIFKSESTKVLRAAPQGCRHSTSEFAQGRIRTGNCTLASPLAVTSSHSESPSESVITTVSGSDHIDVDSTSDKSSAHQLNVTRKVTSHDSESNFNQHGDARVKPCGGPVATWLASLSCSGRRPAAAARPSTPPAGALARAAATGNAAGPACQTPVPPGRPGLAMP